MLHFCGSSEGHVVVCQSEHVGLKRENYGSRCERDEEQGAPREKPTGPTRDYVIIGFNHKAGAVQTFRVPVPRLDQSFDVLLSRP